MCALVTGVQTCALPIWGFLIDSKTNTAPGRQFIYVQDWAADRSDADIIAQQKVDLLKRVAAINRKQQEFRNVADQFGIEWRKEAKAGDAREKEAVAAVMARLDKLDRKSTRLNSSHQSAARMPTSA